MLIALLIALGVDIVVIVAIASLVVGRRRWLERQPGTFSGAIRIIQGTVDGVGSSWKRGSGRWVRDVLVWNRAPFKYQNLLIPIDGIAGQRPAAKGETKRIGAEPTVIVFQSGDVVLEVATAAERVGLAAGPFSSALGPRGRHGDD